MNGSANFAAATGRRKMPKGTKKMAAEVDEKPAFKKGKMPKGVKAKGRGKSDVAMLKRMKMPA